VGISPGSGVPPNWLTEIVGVCKAYSTRVGGGPFPTELENEIGEHIRLRGREFGTTTGRPRRCGWFDAVAVRYAARLSGATSVALTMLDVLSEMETIQVCTGYDLDGQSIPHFPGHANELWRVKPVYESIPGWQQEIRQARTLDDLPIAAIAYVVRLEELIGRRVEFISVGPDRKETIFVDKTVRIKDYLTARRI
jgi:adenylosuccinate synthase